MMYYDGLGMWLIFCIIFIINNYIPMTPDGNFADGSESTRFYPPLIIF